jgi:hypothetical protein
LHPPKKILYMKIKILLFPAFMLVFSACKKSEDTNTPPPQQDTTYLTTSAGSTWNYHETDASGTTPIDEDYTLTSTSRDTSINGKSYHIFSSSDGNTLYFNITGHDYYQFDSLPAALGPQVFERLYLKDNVAVATTWTQNIDVTLPGAPFPVPIIITYNILEKGISRTVNGINYTDVIHVATSIHSSLIPSASLTSDINSYYAKKYGLIEASTVIGLDFMGIVENINIETKLVSSNLL